MIKNGVDHSSLIRPIAKLLVPKNKRKFRLSGDPDTDNWNNYKTNGEKVTVYDQRLLFRDTDKVFTLKGDILSMITDYDFNKTHLVDAKQIINHLDEMHFDIHAKGRHPRDKNLIKSNYNKRAILASGLKTIFVSENPNDLCDRLLLLLKEKKPENNINIINEEIVAILDKLLSYKCVTRNQHKKLLKN